MYLCLVLHVYLCVISIHLLSLYFFLCIDFPVIPACYDGDVRLSNNYTRSPYRDGKYLRESIQGYVEICYDGTYYGLCSGDYNQQVAETVCSNLGYNSSEYAVIDLCCCIHFVT